MKTTSFGPGVACFLAVSCLLTIGCNTSNEPELGAIDFQSSATGRAKDLFEQGVLLLHSFEYAQAADAFRASQEADPDFVLAFWGEAMTYNHPVWNEQDVPAARSALDRLAGTSSERSVKARTDRERDYLNTIEILYGEGTKELRDTLYSDAMAKLVATYPDDAEARAFYSLSLLGLSQGDRNIPTYMRAGAIAQEVFDRNRNHPGAAHYLIHSFDDPVHAPLGLSAARAYSDIAPGAAHAQHMTSHIFVAMGMWDDVVVANQRAAAVVNEGLTEPYECGHYNEWLEYGYLQRGEHREAARLLASCFDDAGRGDIARSPQSSFAYIRALNIVDSEEWEGDVVATTLDGIETLPRTRLFMAFGNGYAAAQRGDLATAESALREMDANRSGGDQNATIMHSMIRSLILKDRGQSAAAVRELRQAADLEETLPFAFGPPATAKPPRELLGDLLLEMGRDDEAFVAYSRALTRTPRRAQTLLGVARTAGAIGRSAYAESMLAELRSVWEHADADVTAKLAMSRGTSASGATR